MKILITGGAGFIGSNLCEYFVGKGYDVVCLDNLSTGFEKNIEALISSSHFTFMLGDIRNIEDCNKAVSGCDYVLHHAALGSVPRSINDPITTNATNIVGFLNMLVAAKEHHVKRFVYAASSSTYGDSVELPKIEHRIGKPLSPYAITKYVNELYANVFSDLYHIETIGLRYFNVFGKRQSPNGAYAAVIPLWVKALIDHESPIINGDGSYSRDFTYIENVIQANELAITTSPDELKERAYMYNMNIDNRSAIDLVFNVAYGGNTNLNELFYALRDNLAAFDSEIKKIEPEYRENRLGDIPHSLASIEKAKRILGYNPLYSAPQGLEKACEWYWNNLKQS
jgi:UDP-N-acetylglucosamine 4-epimerase